MKQNYTSPLPKQSYSTNLEFTFHNQFLTIAISPVANNNLLIRHVTQLRYTYYCEYVIVGNREFLKFFIPTENSRQHIHTIINTLTGSKEVYKERKHQPITG